MKVLKKDLGIDNKVKTDSTYEYLPNTIKEVLIHSHSRFILKNFQQKRKEENQFLPEIYWIPKLHKNSSEAMFIIAPPKNSL